MRNPNVFSLGLDDLEFDVTFGNVQVGSISATTAQGLKAGATGTLSLTGEITASAALLQLARGKSLGKPSITCRGTVRTPYGPVRLGE